MTSNADRPVTEPTGVIDYSDGSNRIGLQLDPLHRCITLAARWDGRHGTEIRFELPLGVLCDRLGITPEMVRQALADPETRPDLVPMLRAALDAAGMAEAEIVPLRNAPVGSLRVNLPDGYLTIKPDKRAPTWLLTPRKRGVGNPPAWAGESTADVALLLVLLARHMVAGNIPALCSGTMTIPEEERLNAPFLTGMALKAALCSKHPHTTCWLELDEPEQPTPQITALHATLAAIGWHPGALPPLPFEGRVTRTYMGPPGSAPFDGWTNAEGAQHMLAVEALLAAHGVVARRWKKTMADMI
jgi:hypothetical protein